MRVPRATAGTVLAAAIITAGASTVSAAVHASGSIPAAAPAPDRPANPMVQPNPAAPGTRVWVYDANECTIPSGTATSQALAAPIALAPLADMTGGAGTIREDLAAGTYTITFHCGSTLTATVDVDQKDIRTGAAATGDGSAENHLGIGDAAVGGAFLVGGLAFLTTSLVRRRRAASAQE